MEHGVPSRHISLEDRSTSTFENIDNARLILTTLGAQSVVIVTDQYHALRARLVARHLDLKARTDCPVNTGTKPLRTIKSYAREVPAILLFVMRNMRR